MRSYLVALESPFKPCSIPPVPSCIPALIYQCSPKDFAPSIVWKINLIQEILLISLKKKYFQITLVDLTISSSYIWFSKDFWKFK